MGLLCDLREEGKAIFMSTHDIFRASEFADRVAIMKTGRLLATMSREELKARDLHKIYLDFMSN
jgi:ABC-2 type transport system ATP-binding protein